MICRVFFHLSDVNEEIPSSRPLDMSAAQVWTEIVPHLLTEDDYVGLVDGADNVLQILGTAERADYWVELPLAEERASLGRVMTAEELKVFLDKLPSSFKPRNFPDFERRGW